MLKAFLFNGKLNYIHLLIVLKSVSLYGVYVLNKDSKSYQTITTNLTVNFVSIQSGADNHFDTAKKLHCEAVLKWPIQMSLVLPYLTKDFYIN